MGWKNSGTDKLNYFQGSQSSTAAKYEPGRNCRERSLIPVSYSEPQTVTPSSLGGPHIIGERKIVRRKYSATNQL